MLRHWKINTIWTTQKLLITKEFSNFLFLLLHLFSHFILYFMSALMVFDIFSFPWRFEISIFNLGRAFWVSYWAIINKESKKESCNGKERFDKKYLRWNDPHQKYYDNHFMLHLILDLHIQISNSFKYFFIMLSKVN